MGKYLGHAGVRGRLICVDQGCGASNIGVQKYDEPSIGHAISL